jgi:hypothetical protein
MGKYGQAAANAVTLLTNGKAVDPEDAWRISTSAIFRKSRSSRAKSCPRDAFLGVCEAGLVVGVPPGSYTTSVDNKAYAVTAARLLKANPALSQVGAAGLWRLVMSRLKKSATHNQQMDVVKTLFDHGLI